MTGPERGAVLRAAARMVVFDCEQNPGVPAEGPEGDVTFWMVHPEVLDRLRDALAAESEAS